MRIKSGTAWVDADATCLTIRNLVHGEKRIPYQNIASVQLRQAGLFSNGFIRFGVVGGNDAKRPMLESSDENGLVFGRSKNSDVLKLRNFVEEAIAKARGATNDVQTPHLIADELLKLAALRDSGNLSETEFSTLKARLLGT